jgi:TPR repeat protein
VCVFLVSVGKGVPEACHSAGDYFSIVKADTEKASKLYEANCTNNNHGASCFSLGRMYCK